jgi:WD40 repeat protein
MRYFKKFLILGIGVLFVYPLFAQKPEVVLQTGHTGNVTSLAISPDERYLLTGSADNTAKLWDMATGIEICTFKGHSKDIFSVAISLNGQYILTGSNDKTAKLWDLATGIEVRTFQGHSAAVRSVAFSPDGSYALTGSWDKTALLWEASTGRMVCTFQGHSDGILSVAFSPDGGYVLTGSEDNTAKLWDAATGIEVRTFQGHSSKVLSVTFSPDGRYVLTGSGDESAKLWDAATATELRTFRKEPRYTTFANWVNSVAFSSDSRYVLTGNTAGETKLWDTATGVEIRSFQPCETVNSVAFSSDSRHVLAGCDNHAVKLWNASTGILVRSFEGYVGFGGTDNVIISPKLKHVLTRFLSAFRNYNVNLKVWNALTGVEIRSYPAISWHGIESIAFSQDERYLAIGDFNQCVQLLDLQSGLVIHTLKGHSYAINSVVFSHNGRYILTGSLDNSARLWDMTTGLEVQMFRGHQLTVNSVALSSDGKYVLTGSNDKTGKLWQTRTGVEICTLVGHTDNVKSVAFSPDDRYLLTGSWDKTAKLWDAKTRMLVQTLKGHESFVNSVAFSPDGFHILTGSFDRTAKLWNAATGKELQTLRGHSGSVDFVTFSSDGQFIITSSSDRSIKLWNAVTGRAVATLVGVEQSGYVITMEDGYYVCSKGALRGVAFRFGNKVFPFEQFDLKLNRPDIVMQRIGYAEPEVIETYHQAYLRRLRKMGFKEEDLSAEMHLPEAKLDWKSLPASIDSRKVDVSFAAWDDKYLLDRINIFINDVPIFGVRGIDVRDQKVQKVERTIPIELSTGVNKVQVSAHSEKGVESLKETAYITYTGPAPRPDLYVLAIGASEYQNNQYNLGFAAKDASDIISAFESLKGTRFGEVKALPLLNEKATRENIIATKAFFNQSSVDDMALLFVAGHGLVDAEYNYHFGTYDVDFQNPALRGLPYEEIDNLLDGIPARKRLLLLDACFSGEIDKTEMQLVAANASAEVSGSVKMRAFLDKRGIRIKKGLVENALMLQQDLFADLRRGTGAVVISSSSGDEYSFEGPDWKNGVFTYSLLEGLKMKKADENKDGQIQVSELQKYVMERVKALTNGGQNPTVRQENLADDFVVY